MPTSKPISISKRNGSFVLPLSKFSKSNWWDEILEQETPSSKLLETMLCPPKYLSENVSITNLTEAALRKSQNVTEKRKRVNCSKKTSETGRSLQSLSQMEYCKLGQKSGKHSSSKTSFRKLRSHSYLLKKDWWHEILDQETPSSKYLEQATSSENTSMTSLSQAALRKINQNVTKKGKRVNCSKKKTRRSQSSSKMEYYNSNELYSSKDSYRKLRSHSHPLKGDCSHKLKQFRSPNYTSTDAVNNCHLSSIVRKDKKLLMKPCVLVKKINRDNIACIKSKLQSESFKNREGFSSKYRKKQLCTNVFPSNVDKTCSFVSETNMSAENAFQHASKLKPAHTNNLQSNPIIDIHHTNILKPILGNVSNKDANENSLCNPISCQEKIEDLIVMRNVDKDALVKQNYDIANLTNNQKCTSYDTEKLNLRACYVVLNKVHSKAVSNKDSHVDKLPESNPNFHEEITGTNGTSTMLAQETNLETKNFVRKKSSKDFCNTNFTQSKRKLRSSSMSVKLLNNELKKSEDMLKKYIKKKKVTVINRKPECSSRYHLTNSVNEEPEKDFPNENFTHAKRKLCSSRYVSVKFSNRKFNKDKDVSAPKYFKKFPLSSSSSQANKNSNFCAQNKSVNYSKDQTKNKESFVQTSGEECLRHFKKNNYCNEVSPGSDETYIESMPQNDPDFNLNKPITSQRSLRSATARTSAQINNCKQVSFLTNSSNKNLDESHSIATLEVTSNRDGSRSSERIKVPCVSQHKYIAKEKSSKIHYLDEEKVMKEKLEGSDSYETNSDAMVLRSSSKIYHGPFCDFNESKDSLNVTKSSCTDDSSFITPKSKTLPHHSDQIKGKRLFGSYDDNCNFNKDSNHLEKKSNLNLSQSCFEKSCKPLKTPSERHLFRNSSLNKKSRAVPQKYDPEFRLFINNLYNKKKTISLNWKAICNSKFSHLPKSDKMSSFNCIKCNNASLVEKKQFLINKGLSQPISNFYIKTRNKLPSHFYEEHKFHKRNSKLLHSIDFDFLEPP